MPLRIDKPAAEGQDVFVVTGIIKDAKDISGVPVSDKWTPNLGIEITVDIGRDFFPTMRIAGDITEEDWGSAFKVRELLLAAGVTGFLTEDNKIPEEAIKELIGKTIKFVRFRAGEKDGKSIYYNWDLVFPAVASDDKIKEVFYSQVTRSKYLAKRFKPSGAKEDSYEDVDEDLKQKDIDSIPPF